MRERTMKRDIRGETTSTEGKGWGCERLSAKREGHQGSQSGNIEGERAGDRASLQPTRFKSASST